MTARTARQPTAFHPFTGRDLPHLVDAQAAARPTKPFVIFEPFDAPPAILTYGDLAHESRCYAAGMVARGIGRGDFVTIHLDNCLEFLIAWFACSRIGAVAVTTNTRATQDELAYFIAHSGSVAAITQPKYAALVQRAGERLRWVACTARDWDGPSEMRPATMVPFEDLRADDTAAPVRIAEPLLPNSVQYTSGTTARPKGVMWTHANALWSAHVCAAHARLTERDVHIFYFPLFHTNALAWSMLATLASGGTAVLLPRFSSSRFWTLSRRYGCTWAHMVMFTLRALAQTPDPEDHSFRFWGGTGDLSFVRERWGIKTIGWFGMTETVSQCTVSSFDEIGPEDSMGMPALEYEVAVRREDGTEVAFGETGHLWIRGIPGISLFYEYLNDPDATAHAFDARGWFATGDLASVRSSGHFFFEGRAKDMLKVGGENVAAIEIESAIAGVPGVVEVAVVGRADPMLDEVPVAFVVAEMPGAELEAAIHAACRRALSDFKRPREIRFVPQLPKGLLDKVLKKELRALLQEHNGSG